MEKGRLVLVGRIQDVELKVPWRKNESTMPRFPSCGDFLSDLKWMRKVLQVSVVSERIAIARQGVGVVSDAHLHRMGRVRTKLKHMLWCSKGVGRGFLFGVLMK